MAYTYDILPNSLDSSQQVPSWVITFVRWANRFPSENTSPSYTDVKNPMVVINDCVSVSVNMSKASHTHQASLMLRPSEVNYETAIAPGDFFFVNILNDEKKAEEVAQRAATGNKPINLFDDGFKGLYKVQSVRRVLAIDPGVGTRRVLYQVQGFSFTELNNTIYFNPNVISQGERATAQLFITQISDLWRQRLGDTNQANVQDTVRTLFEFTLGQGVSRQGRYFKGILQSPNVHFLMPTLVSTLLGVNRGKAAKDIYNLLLGVQQYGEGARTPELGFNPANLTRANNVFSTKVKCQGNSLLKAEYWNQVTSWNILNQYVNAPINELFTALRVDPDGYVMPTVVMRQIPFSSDKYKGVSTKFMNLPRWRVAAELLRDINLGRDETLRVNYVQVFGVVSQMGSPEVGISRQIESKNYVYDIKDVQRSGLKPYIITSNFDFLGPQSKSYQAIQWARLLGDILIGGQLRMSGSITVTGIEEPIAVGDNLELDNVVYHIESVAHTATLGPNGNRNFSTTVQLSHGMDVRSDKNTKVFPKMDNPNMEDERKQDFDRYDMLPTQVSDAVSISKLEPQTFNDKAVVRTPPPAPKKKAKKRGKK